MSYAIRAPFVTRTQFKFSARILAALSAATVGTAYLYNNSNHNNNHNQNPFFNKKSALLGSVAVAADENTRLGAEKTLDKDYYQKVYNSIANKLIECDDYDDGSYGPILVRLAWHHSGSYDQNDPSDKKGGSFAGTIRFKTEQNDPANAGLTNAVKFLGSIYKEYPEISYGDLVTLGGVCAVQEMSGPKIPWRPGRIDMGEDVTPPYGRLPDASQTKGEYLREVFHKRLGFTDEEIVALIGVGHAIGRCHTQFSGYDGPWTYSPTTISNEFFRLLLEEDWQFRNWDGPKQYENKSDKSLMMLPADMILKKDPTFRKISEVFAKDEAKCMNVFSSAFVKLIERGGKFNSQPIVFKTLEEQEN